MKKTIFIFLLMAMWVPFLQEQFEFFTFKPLSGATNQTGKPAFTLKQWMEGGFQNNYSEFTEETFGLRNFFVRLYNQFDFSVFSKSHCEVVVGQNHYLFQKSYTDELTGESFIGDEAMRSNINNIKSIENYLNEKNISLITVLAPGKTDYYKEYLSNHFTNIFSNPRNYTSIIKYSSEINIRLIDLNKWFLQLKDTSRYPLFPRQGIHWNYYGMALSADTIIKYIEALRKIDLPDISWTLEHPDSLRGTDYDLGELLNINQTLQYNKMPYPKFTIVEDSSTIRPRLLVIGDSFYWTIFNEGIFGKVFSNETYYYYCSSIYPEGRAPSKITSDLNLLNEVEKYDLVILLQSTANYNNPGVNFIQTIMNELKRRDEYRNKAKESILKDQTLLNKAMLLSGRLSISQDSSISLLSDSLADLRLQEISNLKIEMRNNPEWLQQLYEKSNTGNIPLDQVMQGDAEWMVDHQGK